MAYVAPNFETKKALKKALDEGRRVSVYQPGLGTIPADGPIHLEGPNDGRPHTWYAEGTMKDGRLVKVK